MLEGARAISRDPDERPALRCYHLEENYIVTTNGFQLHIVKRSDVPELAELPAGNYRIDEIAGWVEPLPREVIFPGYTNIVPGGQATFKITLRADLLRAVIKGADGFIDLLFTGADKPVEIRGTIPSYGDGEKPTFQAVLMPAHASSNNAVKPIVNGLD